MTGSTDWMGALQGYASMSAEVAGTVASMTTGGLYWLLETSPYLYLAAVLLGVPLVWMVFRQTIAKAFVRVGETLHRGRLVTERVGEGRRAELKWFIERDGERHEPFLMRIVRPIYQLGIVAPMFLLSALVIWTLFATPVDGSFAFTMNHLREAGLGGMVDTYWNWIDWARNVGHSGAHVMFRPAVLALTGIGFLLVVTVAYLPGWLDDRGISLGSLSIKLVEHPSDVCRVEVDGQRHGTLESAISYLTYFNWWMVGLGIALFLHFSVFVLTG